MQQGREVMQRAALSKEIVEARIAVRVAELKVLAAETALGKARDDGPRTN